MRTANENLRDRLARHPFLKGMAAHHVDLLAQCASEVQFREDETIFSAGEAADRFYLIESGSVGLRGSVMEHGENSTDVLGAGEPLGWSWLFPPYRWHFDARALEPVRAISFSAAALHQHRDDDLSFSHELFKRASEVMVRRLQHARKKLTKAHRPAATRSMASR